ncbi:MAG: tail fiber protein [Coleofasciculus sp. G3-WIS-01]|uniref:phage tail protein n=1 Tax=Coleofasciculus sp. G3-WIS-01 TaxID=3069528 RepID=UPI0032F70D9A
MTEPFIGQIIAVAFPDQPPGWVRCDGDFFETTTYPVLFELIKYTYGRKRLGDKNYFAVPDLRGRVPIHMRPCPMENPANDTDNTDDTDSQTTYYNLGDKGGEEKVQLEEKHLPPHKHKLKATSAESDCNLPDSSKLLGLSRYEVYGNGEADIEMHPDAIAPAVTETEENCEAHENMQPYLTLNFLIAVEGRNPRG